MARPQKQLSFEDYHRLFVEADVDRNGYLTYKQFTKLLKQMGYGGKNSDMKKHFKKIDTSGDKKLSEAEFMEAMGMIPEDIHMSARLRLCFRKFDQNNDGKIDRNELDEVLLQMGIDLSPEEVGKMMQEADKDGSGKLDYEEFIDLLYPE